MTSQPPGWARLATAGVAQRRASIRSRWRDWVGPAAAAWSLGYGLLGLYWTLGGAGFPFGTEHDPHAAKVSILEQVQQDAAAPVIAALGLGGAVLAMVMARRRPRGPLGAALLGFAWSMAVALAVVIPDVRPLTAVAR
jgi:cytochrome bd-type quinol oxidase subunit 2